ncbi:uncharacterized protein LOC142348817 isoform X2 [Convolutriloba macropyga]|uniref:uncharacterized protein LOC142348817 isoform X2 n=1 Tax=Convolutriloba macropyga TaxID=536237 RepID=UPI003F51E1C3
MHKRMSFDEDKNALGENNPRPDLGPTNPKNSNVSPTSAGPSQSIISSSGEPETRVAQEEICDKSSAWINVIVSVVIALLYAALFVVAILVCLYSIRSLYIASNVPVTSTTIDEQEENFEPPVLLLMFATEKVASMCRCSYTYFSADVASKCDVNLLKSNSERYLKIIDPESYREMRTLIEREYFTDDIFMEIAFLYFKGPSNWHKLEVLKVDCDLEQNLDGTTNLTFESKPIVEYLFLPSWKEFADMPEDERDVAVYKHLKNHPGMRFFPYGFENFALISRTEIWDVESTSPTVRLQTEISLSLIDREGFIGESNSSRFVVEVQWKDGLVTQVKSVITATKWSSVSVVCTMLLMLEKAYGYGTRIYASIKSEREKKKIQKQMRQQRELAENGLQGRKSGDVTPSSTQSPRAYFSEPKIKSSHYDSTEIDPSDGDDLEMSVLNETRLSNGHIKKDNGSNYNPLPSYEQSLTIGEPTINGVNEKGDMVRNESKLRNRKQKADITSLNLSRLRRNLVEISAILKESGISLDESQIEKI